MTAGCVRNGSGAYAPCECGAWPTPSDQRANHCRACWHYRPATWDFARTERRARGWRALALAALYPLRFIAARSYHTSHHTPEEGRR